MTKETGAAPGRIPALDAWRGIAVLTMAAWHLGWDLGLLKVIPLSVMLSPPGVGIRYFIVCSFVLLSGICARFSRNALRRGLVVLLAAAAVTAVTVLVGDPAWFGILHMLGCSLVLYALLGRYLERLPERGALMGYLLLFVVLHAICYSVRVDIPWLFVFGLRTPDFRSSDYYPLVPWLFLFLAGTVLGGWIRASDAPWKRRPAPGALVWIGRHALWIYLLHQPALLAILALLTGKTVW